MSECVTGYIDHIIFRNEDNGYTVMVLKGVKDEDELTCVGTFPVITQGASIEAEGNFIQHPVYGKQFQAVRLTEKMPEDAMAMERYLGYDVFAKIWNLSEPRSKDLSEIRGFCVQCFTGKSISPGG